MPGFDDEVTVVIPTLNEAEAIGAVLDELIGLGVGNIIVIDGRSSDGTAEIARGRGVRVVVQRGRGKADAVLEGFRLARTRYVLLMDGDYTYPARHVFDLYSAVREGFDEVIGRRVYGPGSSSLLFRLGNKFLTWFFNLVFGTSLGDVLSGMYIVRRGAVEDMLYKTRGFSIESEIAAHIASTGGEIGEVPIEYRRRLGEKKLKVWHGLLIFLDMVRLAWAYNPVFVLFSLGSLLLVPGLLLAGWVLYELLFAGVKHHIWALISVMLATSGFLSLLFAIFAIYVRHMELRLIKRLRGLEKRVSSLGE